MFSGSDFLLALIAVTKLDITNNCSLKKRRNKVTRKRQRRRVCPRCLLSLTPAWLPLAWPCGAHGLARGCGQLPRPMWLPFFSAPDYTGNNRNTLITEITLARQCFLNLFWTGVPFWPSNTGRITWLRFPCRTAGTPLFCTVWHAEFWVPLYSSCGICSEALDKVPVIN